MSGTKPTGGSAVGDALPRRCDGSVPCAPVASGVRDGDAAMIDATEGDGNGAAALDADADTGAADANVGAAIPVAVAEAEHVALSDSVSDELAAADAVAVSDELAVGNAVAVSDKLAVVDSVAVSDGDAPKLTDSVADGVGDGRVRVALRLRLLLREELKDAVAERECDGLPKLDRNIEIEALLLAAVLERGDAEDLDVGAAPPEATREGEVVAPPPCDRDSVAEDARDGVRVIDVALLVRVAEVETLELVPPVPASRREATDSANLEPSESPTALRYGESQWHIAAGEEAAPNAYSWSKSTLLGQVATKTPEGARRQTPPAPTSRVKRYNARRDGDTDPISMHGDRASAHCIPLSQTQRNTSPMSRTPPPRTRGVSDPFTTTAPHSTACVQVS